MGTNYYHELPGAEDATCSRCGNLCRSCGEQLRIHIGKSSFGWTFNFQATDTIRSYRDWLAALEAGGIIRDEYGEGMTLDDFKLMVAQKQEPLRDGPAWNHAEKHPSADDFLDPEGHAFSTRWFS